MKQKSIYLSLLSCLLLSITGCNNDNTSTQSAVKRVALNDTGITMAVDAAGNLIPCDHPEAEGQDCRYGRDATHNDNQDGVAGFSFSKISAAGEVLPVDATSWACVKDNVTGLVWENKTTDGGLHDTNRTYRWGGVGTDTSETTLANEQYHDWDVLMSASNSERLCGFTDWRVPAPMELVNIVNYGAYAPAIDANYFPNTQSKFYWSNSAFSITDNSGAYGVNFESGLGYATLRYEYHPVRLVRGE